MENIKELEEFQKIYGMSWSLLGRILYPHIKEGTHGCRMHLIRKGKCKLRKDWKEHLNKTFESWIELD